MHTVEEAIEVLARAAGTPRCEPERVPLDEALGRVLVEPVAAPEPVPPFARSAMDGFAVRADVAVGAEYPVAGTLPAGTWPEGPLPRGVAVRIMTGAPVPDGTERVIPVEWTSSTGDRVRIDRLGSDAAYIVPRGAHVAAGEIVVAAGTRLGPGDIGALATAGRPEAVVARVPRVAVLGTGSELVPVGTEPGPGQVRNSNAVMLRAQVRRAGGRPVDLGIAEDTAGALAERIRVGLEADVFVLSGGVSRGDFDLVPSALEAAGVENLFHRWRVQPGGPLWLGVKGDVLVFGLPGNPAASFVGFEILVVPAIRHALGLALEARETLRARYGGTWRSAQPRRRFRPARLTTTPEGELRAEGQRWTGSGDPFAATRAEALVAIAEDRLPPAGDEHPLVEVLPLGSWA